MRELPIQTSNGAVDAYAAMMVLWMMRYPEDEAKARDAALGMTVLLANGMSHDTLPVRLLDEEFNRGFPGWFYAGNLFMLMVQFQRYYPDLNVGILRASYFSKETVRAVSREHATTKRSILTYWKEYKNSAHLWAAYMLVFKQLRNTGSALHGRFFVPNCLPIISMADQMVPMVEKSIKDWNPWRAPEGTPAVSFEIPKPDDDDMALLRSYAVSKNT